MKKITTSLFCLSLLTLANSSFALTGVACASPGAYCSYTDVLGQFSSTRNTGMGGMPSGPHIQQASPQQRAKGVCINIAKQTGTKCEDAYLKLQPVCIALTGFVGAKLGAMFWSKALDVELDARVVNAMALGVSTAGLATDDLAINCTYLTNQAKSFCEAGAKKMESEC